jgi:cellulose synthase/poly-beta-1,6-N-acetylglucosamine synthase-like glycosyltransferase
MIPVRNEEENLKKTLPSIESLDYERLEIIYYNDDSSDDTAQILREFKSRSKKKISLLEKKSNISTNKNKPKGKVAALVSLSEYEKITYKSDILIFTDADDVLDKHIITHTVKTLEDRNLDMFSLFPGQEFGSLTERMFSPIADIVLFTLLLLALVERTKQSSLAAANGQWIAIKRDVYDSLGGFEGLKNTLTEDTDLARKAKVKGYRVAVHSGVSAITTRMYSSTRDIFKGFSKNFYGISGGHSATSIMMGIMYAVSGFGAVVCVFSLENSPLSLLPILFMLLWRGILSEKLQHGIFETLLFPITSLFMLLVSINSAIVVPRGKAEWKGRRL